MDETVRRAMARWPDVPAVHGWLRLDRRGRWHLVDRGRPGFDPVRDAGGSPITNTAIVDFIDRNYLADADGAWYWQNGPQRVCVDLDTAPLVLRVTGDAHGPGLLTHGGERAQPRTAFVDPAGTLYLDTDLGPGAVHDLDLAALDIDFDADPSAPLTGAPRAEAAARDPRPGAVAARHGAEERAAGVLRWRGATLAVVEIADAGQALGFVRRPRPPARAASA